MKKQITILVPVYNEVGNIAPLAEAVSHVFKDLSYGYELLFVDDGSTDDTLTQILELEAADNHVRSLALSRNFGKEVALSAGLAHAEGDAVILMDGDLQHPPEVIPEFIAHWEDGADVVIGIRRKNPDEGLFRSAASKFFSYLMRTIGNIPTVSGATDFRLLDRVVIDEFKRFTERGRITRGLIDWLGFTRSYITFDARRRHSGVGRYSYGSLIRLFFSAIFAHSMLPLRFAVYLGIPITIFAGGLGLFTLVEMFLLNDPLMLQIPGTAMLGMMILFLNGILLISIGLVSLYIEKIHSEAVNRPLYVLRKPRGK